MPVRTSAAVNIKIPKIIIEVSLPKPSKAMLAGKTPVRISAIIRPRAITSAGKVSIENRTSAARMMMIKITIERVITMPITNGQKIIVTL